MERQPENVGPYQLVRPLGAGGMAETFIAVKRGPAGFEQKVCLKRILPGRAADPVFVELFLDEARLLARLQCQSITHVLDFGEADGCYYMALELIDGSDLDALLVSLRERGLRMPQEVALYIVSELLGALQYAHTLEVDGVPQHIVHRDISPSNILLSKQGEVKLTDFGIAKAEGRTHRTMAGQTKGKIAYMSPEQMRAEELDGRSDLFAVGVVLFELLTNEHPFDATTDFALQVNIMNGKRRDLRELMPDAHPQVVALLDALLQPSRDDRPADAEAALAMLPPLTATFSLQRALQQLMGNDPKRAGHAVPKSAGGSAPQAFARGSTAHLSPTPKSKSGPGLVPALIAVAVVLLCGGLAYALVVPRIAAWASGNDTLTPEAPKTPDIPKLPAAGEPSAPTRAEVEPPRGVEPPQEERVQNAEPRDEHVVEQPPVEAPPTSTRAHAERAHHREPSSPTSHGDAPAQDAPSAHGGVPAQPQNEAQATHAAPPARGPLTPALPPPSRTVIQAPAPDDDGKNDEERRRNAAGGSYVAPNGRVVMRAPPPK